MEPVWKVVDETTKVAFVMCTSKEYGWRRYRDTCPVEDDQHGHVLIDSDDGFARVPFCCRSRVGVVAALAVVGSLSEVERQAVWALPEVQALPRELTPAEQVVLRDPALRAQWTNFNFVSV